MARLVWARARALPRVPNRIAGSGKGGLRVIRRTPGNQTRCLPQARRETLVLPADASWRGACKTCSNLANLCKSCTVIDSRKARKTCQGRPSRVVITCFGLSLAVESTPSDRRGPCVLTRARNQEPCREQVHRTFSSKVSKGSKGVKSLKARGTEESEFFGVCEAQGRLRSQKDGPVLGLARELSGLNNRASYCDAASDLRFRVRRPQIPPRPRPAATTPGRRPPCSVA